MLYLIGTGLNRYGLTREALKAAKKCKILYIDNYTSIVDGDKIEELSNEIGKGIKIINRADMEEKVRALIAEAKNEEVGILVGGDPLIATTHKTILIEAQKLGIKFGLVHGASILSAAIGESGLDFYRFGQICTIPKWTEHYKPVSFYETIYENYNRGLHSLILLDYDKEHESTIDVSYAVELLEMAEKEYGRGLINDNARILVLHDIGMVSRRIQFLSIAKAKKVNFGHGVTTLIFPGRITELEMEALEIAVK